MLDYTRLHPGYIQLKYDVPNQRRIIYRLTSEAEL